MNDARARFGDRRRVRRPAGADSGFPPATAAAAMADTAQVTMTADRRAAWRFVTEFGVISQRELVRIGQHRGPGVSDPLLAAAAEVHGAIVVHYDRDFDAISAVTGQPTRWIVPAGSVP